MRDQRMPNIIHSLRWSVPALQPRLIKALIMMAVLIVAGAAQSWGEAPEHHESTKKRAKAKQVGSLSIQKYWAPPQPTEASTAVVYLSIRNRGGEADQLVAASSTAASSVEFRVSEKTDQQAVEPMKAIGIPPKNKTRLHAKGIHLVLVGLTTPLKLGGELPLELTFARAGAVSLTVPVKAHMTGKKKPGKKKTKRHHRKHRRKYYH